MAEIYAAALKGVLDNLQGFCRGSSGPQLATCRRAIEEKVIISEVALSNDEKIQERREELVNEANRCYDDCRFTGRTMVRECNTLCGNKIIQDLWKRVDVAEYERIAAKYA